MTLRLFLLPLLLPPGLLGGLLVLLGRDDIALRWGVLTFIGSAMALMTARSALKRQLLTLARNVRHRAEGAPSRPEEQDLLDEVVSLEGAIDSLHQRLATRNAHLNQEARTLSAVLDGMAEGLWVTDAEGTVVHHNEALRGMLQPATAIIGQRPLALLRNEPLHDAVMRACLDGTSTHLELTVEGLFPRTLGIRVTPLGRDLPGSAAVFHDVTELRRLEKIRKDFVANVSHELRTPITAIRGYAETLQSGALKEPEVAPKMVDIIHRQSERLSELVEDLLELSRLESREVKLRLTDVPLARAASQAAEVVRQKAHGKGITLELSVPASLTARGDERGVEQVLLNLLDNAVKYTPEGGQVRVTGTLDAGRCVVHVRDTGVGIEPKHLARIFERFYRVDKGRSRDMGGTGLGLSIVKHLMSAMGGEVRVESQPGQGSQFTIFLPAAVSSAAVAG